MKYLGLIFLYFYASALSAALFLVFWNWFITPVFPSAPSLSFMQAYGIKLLISFTVFQHTVQDVMQREKPSFEDYTRYITTHIFLSTVFFVMGFLVHLFL